MRKRKAEKVPDEPTTTSATSQEFTSFVSKFSYPATATDEAEVKPSTTARDSSTRRKQKPKVPRSSLAKSRNPGYAPPSEYSHLPIPDLDRLANDLVLLFIGLNPGVATALANHGFAGASNKFWPLLYSSGITTQRHTFEADKSLPSLYRVGITNLIPRPTRAGSELSKEEMLENVDVVEEKVRKYKPAAVCVVGKSIWDAIYERKHFGQKVGKDFKYGWQPVRMGIDDGWTGAKCFVTPSTSGRVAAYSREFQEELWKELGDWVKQERGDIKEGTNKEASGAEENTRKE